MANPKVSVIVAAGGISRRFTSKSKKQFTKLDGIPILAHCLNTFEKCPSVKSIVVVTPRDELKKTEALVKGLGLKKVISITVGGEERKLSVYNGFRELDQDTDVVVIHDAARPLLKSELAETVISECIEHGACIAAMPVTDTIKSAKDSNIVDTTVPRASLWRAQTPQAFRYDILKETYSRTDLEKTDATDESQLVEQKGFRVKIVEGAETNIKITTPDDIKYAQFLIKEGLV